MNIQYEEDVKVAERAAVWFTTLLEGNEQRAEFLAWLAESPQHVEAFLRVVNTAGAIAGLSRDQRKRIENLACDLGTHEDGTTEIVSIPRQGSTHDELGAAETLNAVPAAGAHTQPLRADSVASPWRSRRIWTGRLAAMLIVGFAAFVWLNPEFGGRTYSTGVGEQRVISLSDGSTVAMNTDSEISVQLTSSARTIRLVRGEALFTVAHEVNRPFDVHVADTVIRAVGTEFDVYRQSAGTRVAVINGLVQVSTGKVVPTFPIEQLRRDPVAGNTGSKAALPLGLSTQLVAAGEAAVVSTSGEFSRRPTVDPDNATAWRRSRLVFENETLANIAAEFNRYNSLKIRVLGEAAEEHFSGTFNANAPEAVMQVLGSDSVLQVERIGNEITIRTRSESETDATQSDQDR